MELKFTPHPLLTPPTDEDILMMLEYDPELLAELHRAHEGRIKSAVEDPLKYGFDLEGWRRIQSGLSQHNECLTLGGNTGIFGVEDNLSMLIHLSRYSSQLYGR